MASTITNHNIHQQSNTDSYLPLVDDLVAHLPPHSAVARTTKTDTDRSYGLFRLLLLSRVQSTVAQMDNSSICSATNIRCTTECHIAQIMVSHFTN